MPLSNPGSKPAGWHVEPDGRVGICTETLDEGAALTVNGEGNVSLHGLQVRLTSPNSTPPSLIAAAEIGLQTDEGSSIFLGSGSGTTEYTALSGVAASREGHRFRTGDPAATRMCIADDAVALDVPLRLQLCTLGSIPSASSQPGSLIVISDRGATLQLAFSDGANWLVLGSEDII